jgi:hypothetical protein
MRTNLALLDVGSTWLPIPEVDANILTDLLLERNRSPKLDFRFTEFSEGHPSHMGRISTAPCRHNLTTSSTIQRRPQEK